MVNKTTWKILSDMHRLNVFYPRAYINQSMWENSKLKLSPLAISGVKPCCTSRLLSWQGVPKPSLTYRLPWRVVPFKNFSSLSHFTGKKFSVTNLSSWQMRHRSWIRVDLNLVLQTGFRHNLMKALNWIQISLHIQMCLSWWADIVVWTSL